MKTRTTLLLLVLTLGIGAWVILHERRGPPPNLEGHLLFDYSGRVMEEGRPAIDIDAAEVAGIDIKSAAGTIALKRRADGSWDIVKSIKDRADFKLVKELLEFCSRARIQAAMDDTDVTKNKNGEAALGLDSASAYRITWRKEGGARLASIEVGQTAPLGDACYVRVEDQKRRPDTYIVSPDLRLLLARPVDAFRDPMISRISAAGVQRVVIHKGEGEVEFSRTFGRDAGAAPWVISRPLPNAMGYQAAINEYVTILCTGRIVSWPDAAGAPPLPAMPDVEIALYASNSPDKNPVSLTFFPDAKGDGKTAWCQDKQRKATFRVSRELVDELMLAENPNGFRDQKLANMDPAAVTAMEIQSKFGPGIQAALIGEKWSWRELPGGAWQEANTTRASNLVETINKTKILEFASDSMATPLTWGMDSPAFTVKAGSRPNKTLDNLSLMAGPGVRTLRLGILDDGKIYANFEGEPFIYRIGPELPGNIPVRPVKWRSLVFPGFSARQVRSMTLTAGTDPPIDLKYSDLTFKWSASRDGKDVSAQLNPAATETLALRAGSLQAVSWLDENAENALKSLERPAIVVDVDWEDFGEDTDDIKLVKSRLEIASPSTANSPYCFARHSSSPDPFLVESKILQELLQPLLKKES